MLHGCVISWMVLLASLPVGIDMKHKAPIASLSPPPSLLALLVILLPDRCIIHNLLVPFILFSGVVSYFLAFYKPRFPL